MVNSKIEMNLSTIEEIIEDARNGKMYILVDDPDRENEGDLIIPGQYANPDAILTQVWFPSILSNRSIE